MSADLRLSMLITAQADQARRELTATGQAARELRSIAPEVNTSWSAVRGTMTETAAASTSLQAAINGTNRQVSAQVSGLVASARETARYREELDELRARFNPLFAASRQYEAQLREIADAERLGAISAAEAGAARERAAASIVPMTGAMGRLHQTTGANVAVTANLAAQFNDIGVMALAMQNPLQLAIQQGTQVNQAFGQVGGHREGIRAIGPALLSILSPASLATIAIIGFGAAGVQWLLSLKEETQTTEDALSSLRERVDDLRQAAELTGAAGLDELERRYGRVTLEVLRLAEARERLARSEAEAQLETTRSTEASRFIGMEAGWDNGPDYSRGIAQVEDILQNGSAAAEVFYFSVQRLETASGPQQLADIFASLTRQIEEAARQNGRMTTEQREYLITLTEAEAAARELIAIEEARNAAAERRAEDMLAELDIARLINLHGEDARVVTVARIEAERRAFEESLRTLEVSEAKKDALRYAWEAANGLAAVDMASGIAQARAEAREMADELMRAVGAAQSLTAQAANGLEDARIRAQFQDPVEQAYQLASAQMRRAQGPLRAAAADEPALIAGLDAEVAAHARTVAETARLTEAQRELERSRRSGSGATAEAGERVGELISDLRGEIDLLRESDPVQQEMIRHRGVLAEATAAERAEVEALIRERQTETEVQEANMRAMDGVRNLGRDVLRGIVSDLREGASAGDILANVLDRLADKLTELATARITDALFGTSGSSSGGLLGGGAGGLLASLFGGSGVKANALGDVIGAPTLFAYGDRPGQLGVMGEAGPEAIMPLSHSMGGGVGALVDGRETTLPLTRLSSGKLGVAVASPVQPFALGGTFGPVSAPPRNPGATVAGGTGAPVLKVEQVIHNYAGVPVETREEADASGGRRMVMVIGDMTASAMRQPGNPARRALESSFGVRQRGTER